MPKLPKIWRRDSTELRCDSYELTDKLNIQGSWQEVGMLFPALVRDRETILTIL